MKPFETSVPGKWVLAGEHSVLRGGAAVALPHPEFVLRLRFEPGAHPLQVEPGDAQAPVFELLSLIPGLQPPRELSGRLLLKSTIPQGAGLGSSAALCVAMTRWLSEPLRLPPSEIPGFATRLEDHFHGRSSGMDVAVISAGVPVRFVRREGARPIQAARLPQFTFHDSGLRARTKDCIDQVERLAQKSPDRAKRIDQEMAEASSLASSGLDAYGLGSTALGLEQIARSMAISHRCFESWGLVPPETLKIREKLLTQGALGARLTGAGGGGVWVALWPESPM